MCIFQPEKKRGWCWIFPRKILFVLCSRRPPQKWSFFFSEWLLYVVSYVSGFLFLVCLSVCVWNPIHKIGRFLHTQPWVNVPWKIGRKRQTKMWVDIVWLLPDSKIEKIDFRFLKSSAALLNNWKARNKPSLGVNLILEDVFV